MSGFMGSLRGALAGATSSLDASINETIIRLAVTGLSRAGKTVFITSMIQNLLALGQGRDTLPLVRNALERADGGSRLQRVKVLSAGSAALPYFDHAAKLAELASDTPSWPSRTEDLATTAIELELERESSAGRWLGRRRIRLDILDYPGEWLLDLPLRGKSFPTWSAETLALIATAPRQEIFAEFLAFLETFDPLSSAQDPLIQRGHLLYREALNTCRVRHGLRYLQPGRFLCPGPRGDVPFMWFFPCQGLKGSQRGSAGSLLNERFEAYTADMAASFFDSQLIDFDRQIVLVDVLGALHAGRGAFEDTARAIAEIASSLHYGSNLPHAVQNMGGIAAEIGGGLLAALAPIRPTTAVKLGDNLSTFIRRRRIERVAFAATKADHVPSLRRDNLQNLLRALVEDAAGRMNPQRVSYHAAASILSTTDETTTINDRPVEVVMGLPLGEAKRRAFYPGEVPSTRPRDGFWSNRFFELPTFTPPRLDPTGDVGIPHLGLDEILASVLAGHL